MKTGHSCFYGCRSQFVFNKCSLYPEAAINASHTLRHLLERMLTGAVDILERGTAVEGGNRYRSWS